MTTSKAVLEVRRKLGLNREKFGHRVGVSGQTIWRIENGQQPTTKALVKLALLAKEADLKSLAELFVATRKTNATARVKSVAGTQRIRRVALADLKYASAYLLREATRIEKLGSTPAEQALDVAREFLRNAAHTMHHVRDEVLEVYINEPYSSTRLLEDEMLVRGQRDQMQESQRETQLSRTGTTKRRKSARRKLTPAPRVRA